MDYYAIYLRKSRADEEAEARGEGETLSKHRTALRALAKRRGLTVIKEYAEIVSGSTIDERPEMLALLEDVRRGMYTGVIVNDIDRLGRGNGIEQEIIKNAFIYGHCLIITPNRDIDPANPTDEDMLEFSMFFARIELRITSRRMAVGRIRSAQAGNYIGSIPPYGYKRSSENYLKLVPDENTSDIVRMMFDMYASGKSSLTAIANSLNDMGIKSPSGSAWGRAYIRHILINRVYIGSIIWGEKKVQKLIENGVQKKKRIKGNPVVVENAHPAIVSAETFDKVQQILSGNMRTVPVNSNKVLANPLAGLLYCSKCGKPMRNHGRRGKDGKDIKLSCFTRGCDTSSIYISVLMAQLKEILLQWCADFKEVRPQNKAQAKPNTSLLRKREQLQAQIAKAHELVELGVYAPKEYLERKQELESQIISVDKKLMALQTPTQETTTITLPKIKRVIDALDYATTPEQQNRLLKTIIARIEYSRDRRALGQAPSAPKLVVFPKIRRSM